MLTTRMLTNSVCVPIVCLAVGVLQDSSIVQAVQADEAAVTGEQQSTESIPQLTARIRRSLVVVRSENRTGASEGLGSGFAVGNSGLIVTARHVIGDGRDVIVELPDGKSLRATEVHASSSQLDLAVIRIEDSSLPPLELGHAHLITQGREILALGHPRGFRNSVVTGVISGRHDLDGISMIQLAMPTEPGNSGGPVVDLQGKVLGIVTMKSTASDNLGFAIPVDLLHELLDDPNPIPMERWRTIGALDPAQWTTLFGAHWTQRAGRISVDGMGNSFGGRTLCLANSVKPEVPLEIQVSVRLEDERGAAGLVFHSDGAERHYGFYPSAGQLRLTRFDGPDVESWTILHNAPHPAYRKGEWNTLRVSITEDRITCYVNDQKVIESDDSVIPRGQAGLAAFRGTVAEFRGFLAGATLPASIPDEQTTRKLQAAAEAIAGAAPNAPPRPDFITSLLPVRNHTSAFFNNEADQLERRAQLLRRTAALVHEAGIRSELSGLLQQSERSGQTRPDEVSPRSDATTGNAPAAANEDVLLTAALLIAKLDNEEVDVDAYRRRVDQMANEMRQAWPEAATEEQRLAALDDYLFQKNGFRGSRFEYYVRSNSYLNEVIDDREGLPITLCVLYLALAERLELNVRGIGLPGHFVVRFEPSDDPQSWILIDPFERGRRMTAEEASQRIRGAGFADEQRFLAAQSDRQIIQRMLANLLNLAEANRQDEVVLRYLEVLVELAPDDPEYRAKRLEIRARTGRIADAIADADWFIQTEPAGTDRSRVLQLREVLERQLPVPETSEGGSTGNQ